MGFLLLNVDNCLRLMNFFYSSPIEIKKSKTGIVDDFLSNP